VYPSAKAIARPEVKAFLDFVLASHQQIADNAKIVAMTEEQATKAKGDLTKAES
jgi:hypothetical protein